MINMADLVFQITLAILLFFFLIPIPPGILLFNFLTKKIFGIPSVFRELDRLLYNILYKDDKREKVSEDIFYIFPLFVWVSGFAFTLLFITAHEYGYSFSSKIVLIMVGLSFLLAASFQVVFYFFLKLIRKSEFKVDRELELAVKKYDFLEKTEFGLKRRYKNKCFFLSGIITRYDSYKCVTIQTPHNMKKLFYITLEDEKKLSNEIGYDNAKYVVDNKYPILLKKGWFSLDFDYNKLNTIEEIMDKLVLILKKLEEKDILERFNTN
jgi:hypothetical protein